MNQFIELKNYKLLIPKDAANYFISYLVEGFSLGYTLYCFKGIKPVRAPRKLLTQYGYPATDKLWISGKTYNSLYEKRAENVLVYHKDSLMFGRDFPILPRITPIVFCKKECRFKIISYQAAKKLELFCGIK